MVERDTEEQEFLQEIGIPIYEFDSKTGIGTLDRVYSIIEDSEKTIWVGTRGSLCKYNPKKDNFIRYDAEEYHFPNPIMMGIVDDGQNIWVVSWHTCHRQNLSRFRFNGNNTTCFI